MILKTKNRIIEKLILFMGLLFMFTIVPNFNVKAAWDAHLNDNGDVEIYTLDKKRTSDIYYKTKGVDITRCQYEPTLKEIHPSGNSFAANLANPVTSQENGNVANTFTIPISEIIARAGAIDGAWAKEIQDAIDGTGPAVYIKLDCIMFTYDETGDSSDVKGPFRNIPQLGGGNLPSGTNGECLIEDAYAWANKDGLRTHYNHYLLIGKGIEPEVQDVGDEFVVYDHTHDHYADKHIHAFGETVPAYGMGNWSDDFDINVGIPSSENIKNKFFADRWYGYTNVYAKCVSKKYEHRIYYYWFDPITFSFGHANIDLKIGYATVCFQYFTDPHIYDFTNAEIRNQAFAGGAVHYDDLTEVPMSLKGTYEYIETCAGDPEEWAEEPNWNADKEKHVEFKPKPAYRTSRRIANRAALEAAVEEDTILLRKLISAQTKSRNDFFQIDGNLFMKDNWITGCNFFDDEGPHPYLECDESSAYVNDYLPNHSKDEENLPLFRTDPEDIEGNVETHIPGSVDNGLYYSDMTVAYQRLITKSRAAETHKDGQESFGGE